MSKKRDMHLVPYCGMRNPPKNRRPGTLDECLKAGQVRYYGVQTQTTQINDYIKKQKKLANEKANIKRKKAIKSTNEANKLINKTNVAVRKANKDQIEAKKAVNEAKKRGRPKKNTTQIVLAPAPAKKRGRPRKTTTTTTAKNTPAERFPLLAEFVKGLQKK